MSTEKILADFSGGINAVAAVDKLAMNELLLAENVRLDETGNVASSGAYTTQNTSGAYRDLIGGRNVHSLYWNPSLGAVAGIGQDVFSGSVLGSMTSAVTGKNPNTQKMSFASAPSRVYFDIGSTGYWSDMKNLLTVDWAPPSAASAIVTGPNTAGTGLNNGTPSLNTFVWGTPNGVTSTASAATGTWTNGNLTQFAMVPLYAENFGFALNTATAMLGVQVTGVFAANITGGYTYNFNYDPYGGSSFTIPPTVLIAAALLVNGNPVGNVEPITFAGGTSTLTFGGTNDLWGFPALTAAQVNGATFGVAFYVSSQFVDSGTVSLNAVNITAYQQQSGFVAGTGTTGTLTGTYTWKVTFVATSGEESDGSVASTSVILSGQQGTLTAIPTGDARTGSRNIYRSGGALTTYYLAGSIPDNSTTTYSDNQTDTSVLATGVILSGNVPGDFPNSRLGNNVVRFPVYHYDRVFWVNQKKPNQIIWSKPLNGFAYPSVNFINVGDSKPISRLVSIFGELIIIKTDSIWRLTGTDENSFNLSQTPSSQGTDEPFTVSALPDRIIFANRWGLWVFNGYTSVALTNKLDLWFKQEDRTGKSLFGINGFHPIDVQNPTVPLVFDAVANSEKYVLAYAEAAKPNNNALIVFDLKHTNITKRAQVVQGLPPHISYQSLPLSLAIDPVTGFVYVGDNNGVVSLLDDWNGGTANGRNVNFEMQTGYQNFARGSNQSFWALEFYLNTNGQSLSPHIYYDNGAANELLAPISTTSMSRVVRPLENAVARKAQNMSIRLTGSLNPTSVAGTPQVILNHIKVYFDVRPGRARTGQ